MERCNRQYCYQCTLLCLISIMHLSFPFRHPMPLQRHWFTNKNTRLLIRRSMSTSAPTLAVPNEKSSSRTTVTASTTTTTTTTPISNRWNEQTGGLRRLPVIAPTVEIRNRARRTAFLTRADDTIQNAKQRAKKHGAESLNALSQALCIPLRDTVKAYQRTLRNNLHPFEQVVAELTIRNRQRKDGLLLDNVLLELHEARKMILDATKDWIAKVKDAATAREADVVRQDGTAALLQLFQDVADTPISGLVELQKALRNAPIVQLTVPTMVLVGYPNVGKSSMVRALTTATPEINNYPFTTRGLTIGHYDIFSRNNQNQNHLLYHLNDTAADNSMYKSCAIPYNARIHPSKQQCQIMDSPGVLNREDRNEMELLTIAAMQHLPTAVCFVVDLTNTETMMDQLAVRRQMRQRFPKRPWLDVAAKADLEWDNQGLAEWQKLCHHQGIAVSIEANTGVTELSAAIADCLGQVQLVLAAMNAIHKDD